MKRALASGVLLLLPCAAAAQNWVEVRSPHFTVATDAGGKRGREIAFHFEQLRAVFALLISKDKVNTPVPLQIVAFRKPGEFKRLAPVYNGKPVQLSGFFAGAQDRSYIALDLGAENRWETVFHEYAHSLLNGNYPDTQPWFDEGFAEYFSTVDVNGSMVDVGKPPMWEMELLQQSKWMPLLDLFRVQHDSRTYNEGDQRNIFYAESWIVVHYLYDKQKVRQAGMYFDLLKNRKVPMEQAVRQAFGMDAASLLKDVSNYYRSPQNIYRRYKLPLDVDTMNTYNEQHLGGSDVRVMVADLALHSTGHEAETMAELQQMVAQQPDNGAALRSLGYAYLRKNDFKQAGEHFSRAAALNTQDAWVYYYSALLRHRQATMSGDVPGPHELAEDERELRAAIALHPQFADAYHLLGLAEIMGGDYDGAVRDLLTAVQLSPRNDLYLANLGNAYLMDRKWDAARALLERAKDSDDPEVARMAANNLARIDTLKNQNAYQAVPSSVPADYTAPQWRPQKKDEPASAAAASDSDKAATAAPSGGVEFAKGTLLSVDCSAKPSATLTVAMGKKNLALTTPDVAHLVVIGADAFSCDWKDRRVAVNYRVTGPNTGTLVSVEVE